MAVAVELIMIIERSRRGRRWCGEDDGGGDFSPSLNMFRTTDKGQRKRDLEK